MDQPFVSVIMPSYNTDSVYLHKAVESILNQTYRNFELVIVDDASCPAVKNVLSDIEDARIVYIENSGNKGLPYTLNNGIKNSKGKYIFRMDSDDICLPERIQKEVDFFETHMDIDVVASFAQGFGEKKLLYHSSTKDEQIRAELLWRNPIIHPTVAFRATTIHGKNIWYKEGSVAEDFEIWSRMAFFENCHFAVIPEVLLMYRFHSGQVTAKKREKLRASQEEILASVFAQFSVKYQTGELKAYCRLQFKEDLSLREIMAAVMMMKKVLAAKIPSVNKQILKRIYKVSLVKYGLKKKKPYAVLQGVVL